MRDDSLLSVDSTEAGYLCECCGHRFDKVYPIGYDGIYLCENCIKTDIPISRNIAIAIARVYGCSWNKGKLLSKLKEIPESKLSISAVDYAKTLYEMSDIDLDGAFTDWSVAYHKEDFEKAVDIVKEWRDNHNG